jgi:hypothetical protein
MLAKRLTVQERPMKPDFIVPKSILIVICLIATSLRAGERTQNFDKDPNWEGTNNRIEKKAPPVTQDFGYRTTNLAGKAAGEMGGTVTRASEPAFYADKISPRTLNDKLSASGTFAITKTTGGSGLFFGFFKGDQPGATGRPTNSLGLDMDGEGAGARLAVRLITGKNQSCGTFVTSYLPGKYRPTPIRNDGTRYTWKLDYDPAGANGRGQFTFTIHGDAPKPEEFLNAKLPEKFMEEAKKRFPITTTFTVDLPEGYREQGTTFDHFGLLNGMKPGGRMTIHFDDLSYEGKSQDFSHDPSWDAARNQGTYQPADAVGAQNFGYSNTHLAGGEKPGEVGGTFWRTESPVAWYADRVGPLTLDNKLIARGKIAFAAGSPDSGMVIGWFNSKTIDSHDGLKDFVGVRLEGPTRVGHYFAPFVATSEGVIGKLEKAPVVPPDSKPRQFSIEYDPKANNGAGAVVVHLDNESATLNLKSRGKRNAHLDHFGVIAPHPGGSQVKVYLDDLTYTATP